MLNASARNVKWGGSANDYHMCTCHKVIYIRPQSCSRPEANNENLKAKAIMLGIKTSSKVS
jgi:hypothetical protein